MLPIRLLSPCVVLSLPLALGACRRPCAEANRNSGPVVGLDVGLATCNEQPVARVTAPNTATKRSAISLDGSHSYDPDGDSLKYQWWLHPEVSSSGAKLMANTDPTAAFTPDVSGRYDVALVVNDGQLDSVPMILTVAVNNTAPIASAKTNLTGPVNTPIILDGSKSSDPDGDSLTYAWTLTSQPPGSTAQLGKANTSQAVLTPDVMGIYNAQLVVNDGEANSAPANVRAVVGIAGTNPVASAGPNQTVPVGSLVTLDGTGSTDPNGQTLTYAWSFAAFPGTAPALSDPSSPHPTFTPTVPGIFVLSLVVSDMYFVSAPATVTITAQGQPQGGGSGGAAVISGNLRHIQFDPAGLHVYVSNQTMNQIEDYSIAAQSLQSPIAVGSAPAGFDITPDGKTMYVANTGGTNVSVVDLTSRMETSRISITTSSFSTDTPFSIAIAKNGKAMFTTTFAGSGFGGRLFEIDLATNVATARKDIGFGAVTEDAPVAASGDRSVLALVDGDDSGGPLFIYDAASDKWGPEYDLSAFVSQLVLDATGRTILVDGTFVLDKTPRLSGTIPQSGTNSFSTVLGAAFGAFPKAYRIVDPDVGSGATKANLEVLDVSRFLVTNTVQLHDSITGQSFGGSSVGQVAISSDGQQLAVITDHGISLHYAP